MPAVKTPASPKPHAASSKQPQPTWPEANQLHLAAEFARLKQALRSGSRAGSPAPDEAVPDEPPAIHHLTELFALTNFERDLLLLCAGVEMDSELASLCANAHPGQPFATFGLALAILPDPHWSALTPNAPLRRYRLLELDSTPGLTAGALRIDERVLHYLAGVNLVDPRLEPLLTLSPPPHWIAATHKTVAAELAQHIHPAGRLAPVLHLCGDDPQGQEDAATEAAHQSGLRLFVLRAEDLPTLGPELDQLAQLWRRESLLLSGILLLQCAPAGPTASARRLAETIAGPVLLATRDPIHLQRPLLRFAIDKPAPPEQKQLWDSMLANNPDAPDAPEITAALAQHFRLNARTISRTASQADPNPQALWNACRSLAQPRLEDLAQRIASTAQWDDLILPDAQRETLRQIVAHVRHRMVVYETWGFAEKGRRGLGVSTLFTGESGTGKTLAAEVLAHELNLDLYRIDLSSVVSKYIGESEKNLRQIFDAAEQGGVALLFDEADALFGKRTEVKDSHDRYANIEVGYLLQRLEAFEGLAILTTNFKSSLDRAFQRRLRFIVTFPFPDAPQREQMWCRAFPPQTPTGNLDPRKLAQLHVTGGNIRNIALHAAFLAAQHDQPVSMHHLFAAARVETQKIERPLSESETRGWL
jgi:hypothetical protein